MTQTTTVGARRPLVGQTLKLAALGLVVLVIAAVVIANQAGSVAPGVDTASVGEIAPSSTHIQEAVGATLGDEPIPALVSAQEGQAVPVPSSDGLWDCCWTSQALPTPQAPPTAGPENGIGGR